MKKLLIGILVGMALQASASWALHSFEHIQESWDQDRRDSLREMNEERRHQDEMFHMRLQKDC